MLRTRLDRALDQARNCAELHFDPRQVTFEIRPQPIELTSHLRQSAVGANRPKLSYDGRHTTLVQRLLNLGTNRRGLGHTLSYLDQLNTGRAAVIRLAMGLL